MYKLICHKNLRSRRFLSFLLLCITLFGMQSSYAIPSFSRQTGMACAQCHINAFGPQLNSFGRFFKLTGYTMGDNNKFPPISAMLIGPSFTHSNKDVASPTSPFNKNDNLSADEISVFYAGKIFTSDVVNAGAFAQFTYEPNAHAFAWDNTDIRFTRNATVAGHNLNVGISLNNNPTAQDLWNTTPTWGFPFSGSPVEDLPGPPGDASPLINNLGQTVGGATAYMMVDENIYVEAGAYASLAPSVQRTFGVLGSDTADKIDGGAPYWRVAYQHNFDHTYVEVGQYGLIADILPGRVGTAGTDHYRDLGVDASLQYDPAGDNKHIFQLWGNAIWEHQNLSASQALGNTANRSSSLSNVNITGSYTYEQTYQINLGYFGSKGSTDAVFWGNPSANPDTDGYIVELDYTPFGKADSIWAPYLNARFAVQYVGFTKYLGRSSNYDGTGRDASDNNTLYLNAWFAL